MGLAALGVPGANPPGFLARRWSALPQCCSSVDAGHYPVAVTVSAEDANAKTEVALDVVGQPRLQIAGRDGLVSASAQAGRQASVPIVISNDGSAAADNIELSGSGPNGWKYTSKVEDKDALSKVKVGDKVDIVWTEAVLVSVERGPK